VENDFIQHCSTYMKTGLIYGVWTDGVTVTDFCDESGTLQAFPDCHEILIFLCLMFDDRKPSVLL